MEIIPKFKNGDDVYYISIEDVERKCPTCSNKSWIEKLFHKCSYCENGKIKESKWVVKYYFRQTFINQIIVDLEHNGLLQYLLDGCRLCLWEPNLFNTLEEAKNECTERNK
jgi:hypothetical protein